MSKMNKSRGSIMIWTLLMGISLATVFFFFAQRLGANVASQRQTMEHESTKMFFDSYIDYVEGLDSSALEDIRNNVVGMPTGITGTVTNVVDEIMGTLDAGGSISYTAIIDNPPTDYIKIEWDICDPDTTEILEINGLPASPIPPGGCPGMDYENVLAQTTSPFTLSAPAGPTYYQLTAIESAVLYDNKWQLNLEINLGFRKKLTTNLTFIPES